MWPVTRKSHPFESQRDEAGRLSRLQNLNLSFNYLTGEIPINLSHCIKLKSLILDHNTLVGQIPYQVGSLTKLVKLYLRNNNLTGLLKSYIFRRVVFIIQQSRGTSASFFSSIDQVEASWIVSNSLSGEFPAPLYNLSSLELISLSFNKFSGNLRSNLGNYFPNLQILYLAKCQFIGSIPSSWANASKLLGLDFPVNNFTGNIPKGFGNLRNLLSLNVWSNQLGYGKHDDVDFVNSLTNYSSLQMLHFGDNQFVGTLPHSAVNLSSQLHEKSSLIILQRMNIILDVASALHYLHHECQTLMINCDIKPQNILLDEDLTAHLGDFCLVRLVLEFSNRSDLHQFSSLGVMGTISYAAPEYGMGSEVSIVGDMYNFGILILEILTGRRPTDTLFQASSSLHHFVETALPEKVMEILDKKAFHGEMTSKSTNGEEYWGSIKKEQMECLVGILEIGVACSAESPRDRLTMRQVYSKLTLIREKILGAEDV